MRARNLVVFLAVFALIIAGCAGGGGTTTTTTGGGTTTTGGGGTAITTGTQGTQAASSSTQATTLTTGSNTVLSNLSNVGLTSVAGAPRLIPSVAKAKDKGLAKAGKLSGKLSTSRAARNAAARVFAMKRNELGAIQTASIEDCTDGGTVTATENSTTSFTIAFDQCREGGIQYDGSISLTDSSTSTSYSFTETVGTTASPFTMLEFDSDAYLTLLSNIEAAMTMAVSSGTDGSLVMSVDGTMHVLDYIGQETYHMEFADYTNELDLEITASALTLSITANGGFSEEWTEDGVPNALDAAFVNSMVAMAITADYIDSTYSGQVSIDFTPDECFEGTFVFVTNTAIRYDNTLGYTTQGELVINGNTTILYNADGSITVTVDGSSTTYASEYELAALCDFQTLDEETSTTSEGTGVGNVAGASTMTVTLTWENPADVSNSAANTSDMDLHVNFYNSTAPTNATTGDWYVDYTNDTSVGVCNSPFDATTWDGVDLGTDGTCDVGLDFDDTEGYGPEHITATELPTGYYVVSVNSYSLDDDPSADVSVTLQIGSSLFGPYTHSFITADANGSNYSSSWFRVRDIRVNADGTIDVLAPDTTLNPRGYSPALASAAKKNK